MSICASVSITTHEWNVSSTITNSIDVLLVWLVVDVCEEIAAVRATLSACVHHVTPVDNVNSVQNPSPSLSINSSILILFLLIINNGRCLYLFSFLFWDFSSLSRIMFFPSSLFVDHLASWLVLVIIYSVSVWSIKSIWDYSLLASLI